MTDNIQQVFCHYFVETTVKIIKLEGLSIKFDAFDETHGAADFGKFGVAAASCSATSAIVSSWTA